MNGNSKLSWLKRGDNNNIKKPKSMNRNNVKLKELILRTHVCLRSSVEQNRKRKCVCVRVSADKTKVKNTKELY